MDSVAAKGFGTSASSFPGLLQAVLPCGDHGIVSYSITKHSKDAKQTFPRQPDLAIADLIYSFLFGIFGIFHQLCAKRKDGSFFIVMISCMFFNQAPLRSMEVCMGFQEPRWEVPAFVRAQQAYKAQAYAVQKSLVRKLNG